MIYAAFWKGSIFISNAKNIKLNDFQKNILNDEIFLPGSAVGNIGGIIEFSVRLSYEEFCAVINEIIRATPSLRLCLNKNNELYEKEIEKYSVGKIKTEKGYGGVCEIVSQLIKTPFESIFDNLLFQFIFIEYNGGKALFLKLHHIIGDAVSIVLICKKIDKGIFKLRSGEKFICEDTAVKYRSVEGIKLERAIEYFGGIKDAPQSKIAERQINDYKAEREKFSVPLYKKGMLGEFAAALYIYISAVTDSKKVVLESVLGNRLKSEMNMVGMFANALPLVLEFGDESFFQIAKSINKEMFMLLKYSAYSFEKLKKYNGITGRIAEVSISYKTEEFLPKIECGKVIEFFNGCVDVPIRIFAEEYNDRLDFNIHYKTGAFKKEFIQNMGICIKNIIKQGFEDKKISEIEIISSCDKEIYEKLNDTERKHKYSDLIQCFKAHISAEEAVAWEGGGINGFELDDLSSRAANYIKEKGADVVGIRAERSPEMIAAVLGALKAGAAFMMVSDVIENMEKYCDIVIEKNDFKNFNNKEFECGSYSPDDTAYRVWTSGSSGKPKCIEISRGSLMSRLEWADREFGLKGAVLQKTVNTFDVSVWEMLCVVFGGRVCLLKNGYEKMPDKIAEAMIKYKINIVHFVPSVLNMFIRYAKLKGIKFPYLKAVYSSGEKLEINTVKEFYNVFDASLFNLYGPAECSIDVTGCRCFPKGTDVSIGSPADNTKIYIINNENKIMPAGVYGEICILGELVGKGYAGKEQGGYFKFRGEKAYRTGDIGKLGFDGAIYIRGRKDRQIKIRGMRINLSEIKNIVLSFEGITEAEIIKNNNRIECFYCGREDVEKIKKEIQKRLYAYAVPSVFIKIDKMPLNENGKADINALEAFRNEKKIYSGNLSEDEEKILTEVSKYICADAEDNLFEKGLDSVSILEIVCCLQEKGMNISFGDFYEGINVRNIAKAVKGRKHYCFLKKQGFKKLLICFPYGGGEPQSMAKVSEDAECDVMGIYLSEFDESFSIEKAASLLTEQLPLNEYEEIYVYGQCVGSMAALEFAEKIKEKLKGIILVSPPEEFKLLAGVSPWSFIPDRIIKKILIRAGGNPEKYTKNALKKFRRDTQRYFKYKPHKYNFPPNCNIKIIMGDNDIFIRNSERAAGEIEKRTGICADVCIIKGGKHFLNETDSGKISEIINSI